MNGCAYLDTRPLGISPPILRHLAWTRNGCALAKRGTRGNIQVDSRTPA
jgi:hypothetical protein